MKGKVKDPKMLAAYDYWRASKVFKWLALPPKTPDAIRDTYRAAFAAMLVDPDFKKNAEDTLESFTVLSGEKTMALIEKLSETSDEAIETTKALMKEQGLGVDKKS
jgi:tripartite-type tricarboxylate transporter receptor subunit TctC